MRRIVAFLRFWYDFIVGDDWRVAAGVVAGLAVTAALAGRGVPVWWSMPLVVLGTLAGSLLRATRRQTPSPPSRPHTRASVDGDPGPHPPHRGA
jgi:hypothetical protein